MSKENEISVEGDAAGTHGPRSPLRVMQILRHLAESDDGLSLTRLSELLGTPKTSLFSLLKSLEAGGYVKSDGGFHRLGLETLKLGVSLRQKIRNSDVLRIECEKLLHISSETIIIASLTDNRKYTFYSDVLESKNFLRFTVRPGVLQPLYCSSVGRVFLAYMSSSELQSYLTSVELKRFTPSSVSTSQELEDKLHAVRATGICVNHNGTTQGVTGIAAPVFDATGTVCNAISIVGPTERVGQHLDELKRALVETTSEISRMLGFITTGKT